MKLSILDRAMLLGGVLPKEGSFTTMKQLRVLKEELGVSDEERKVIDMKQGFACKCGNEVMGEVSTKCLLCGEQMKPNGSMVWDIEKDPMKKIQISKDLKKTIEGVLEEMDKKELLTEQHMSLYEKFCAE